MRFDGKAVMISGAASGFGRLAAQRFAAEGARLSLADIDEDGVRETAEGLDALAVRVDVTSPEDQAAWADATVARYGTIDIAVNNAGVVGPMARIPDLPVEEFDRMMAINVRGVFLGMQQQLPVMAKAGGGAILNTASAAGLLGAGYLAAYAASKHAVVGLTRSAADEYARSNVRINAICPSFADTPMLDQIADDMADGKSMTRADATGRITGRVPMRRPATAEEVVQAMLWAVDPANSFMTGQTVSIDGGLTAI